MHACFIILLLTHLGSHTHTHIYIENQSASPLPRSPPRPHRPLSSGGLAPGRSDRLVGWPQSSVRGHSWIRSCIPGSWGGVEWQGGNTNRPALPHPSGIVGVKNYIQSGSIGHRWLHIVGSCFFLSALPLEKNRLEVHCIQIDLDLSSYIYSCEIIHSSTTESQQNKCMKSNSLLKYITFLSNISKEVVKKHKHTQVKKKE